MNSIALKAGNPSYDDVIAELTGTTVPTKIVLEIFNAGTTTYTDSLVDGQCYKVGGELLRVLEEVPQTDRDCIVLRPPFVAERGEAKSFFDSMTSFHRL